MVEFLELILENFMSYRGQQRVVLADQGIVRIEGPNMVGKSSVIEASCWVLYARTLRGLKHDKIVNRFEKKNCRVEIRARIQKVPWRVIRYRKHRKHSNKLILWRKDKQMAFRHESDTQQALESALGFDFSGFVNSTVFGGAEGGRKSFALLTDSERKRILDSFLRFERFELALERAKNLRGEAEQELSDTDNKARDLSGLLEGMKANLDFLKRRAKEQKEADENEISILKRRLKNFRMPEGASSSKIAKLEKALQEKAVSLGRAEAEVSRCEESLDKLRLRLGRRKSLGGRDCPMCGQKVTGDAVEKLLQHVELEKRDLKLTLRAAQHSVTRIESEVKHGRSRLKRLHKQRTIHQRHLNGREALLGALRKLTSAGDASLLHELELKTAAYSKSLSRLIVLEQKKAQLAKSVEDYRFWEEGFGNRGVKALIIREILPALNHKLEKYSREIFGDGTTLQLSATQETKAGDERELLNLRYQSPSGADDYVGESSGGRRRADLCVLLVFSWLARNSNVLFIDEFFDHLDSSGRERALDILQRQRGSIFIVTHERGLKSQLSKCWTVVKENRASRIEVSP